jgi:hypothetical protein
MPPESSIEREREPGRRREHKIIARGRAHGHRRRGRARVRSLRRARRRVRRTGRARGPRAPPCVRRRVRKDGVGAGRGQREPARGVRAAAAGSRRGLVEERGEVVRARRGLDRPRESHFVGIRRERGDARVVRGGRGEVRGAQPPTHAEHGVGKKGGARRAERARGPRLPARAQRVRAIRGALHELLGARGAAHRTQYALQALGGARELVVRSGAGPGAPSAPRVAALLAEAIEPARESELGGVRTCAELTSKTVRVRL